MTTMTWAGLVFVLLMVIFMIALIVKKHWPRDENGEMMDPAEVAEFMEKFPDPSPSMKKDTAVKVILFFASIAMLALAISGRRKGSADLLNDDHF